MTAKRRAKGTGTIVKIGDVYYGRIMIKGKVKKIRLCKNQREAEAQWKDWIRENINTFTTEATRHPLENLWAMMEENWRLQSKSERNISVDKYRLEYIIAYLQKRNIRFLEEVTSLDIINFFESISNLTYGCRRKYKAVIRNIYQIAMPNVPSPVDKMGLKKTTNVAREPFTDDELKVILDYAEKKGHSWKVLIEVGLYTGLRLKDCVFLSTDKIKDGAIQTEPFKTKQKGIVVRIPLHPILEEELKSLGVGEGYYFPEQIELYNTAENCKTSSRLAARLHKIFSQIGDTSKKVEGHLRQVSVKGFHALRATFITRLAERGVSLPIMESIAGHINPQQTMHYTHPDEDVKKNAIKVLPNFQSKIDNGESFIHPEVQKVINICKSQIAETIEKCLGKKVEVKISANEILGGEQWFFNEL